METQKASAYLDRRQVWLALWVISKCSTDIRSLAVTWSS